MGAAHCRLHYAALIAFVLPGCRGPDIGTSETDTAADADAGTDTGTDAGEFDPLVCGSWDHDGPGSSNQLPHDGSPQFTDVTVEAGLSLRQYRGVNAGDRGCIFALKTGDVVEENRDCEPSWFTGGASVGDVNGDGWEDVVVTRLGAPDALFINQTDGTFADEALERGLGACTYTNGTLLSDIDGDRDLDLILTSLGGQSHLLYINDGEGRFSEEGEARGLALTVDGRHGGQSVTAGDYDLDGDLDLHINEWLDFHQMSDGGAQTAPHGSRLLQNQGQGDFVDVTDEAGVSLFGTHERGVYGFSSTFIDIDGDGWQDLAVAADFGSSRLFWNNGDGTFSDGTDMAGVGKESNAMGSAFGDVDGDGKLEWFVTSIAERENCGMDECPWKGNGNRLYRYIGERTFTGVTDLLGVRDGGWAWGGFFGDIDNDGDIDLWQVNGWPGRDLNGGFAHRTFPARLWLNAQAGPMTETATPSGAGDTGQGRTALAFDFDRDGDLDLFAANHLAGPTLLRNDLSDDSNYLDIRLRATASNSEGRGARVSVQIEDQSIPMVRIVGTRGQFLGEHSGPLHFGLAETDSVARIEVQWPSGQSQIVENVAADQLVELTEP